MFRLKSHNLSQKTNWVAKVKEDKYALLTTHIFKVFFHADWTGRWIKFRRCKEALRSRYLIRNSIAAVAMTALYDMYNFKIMKIKIQIKWMSFDWWHWNIFSFVYDLKLKRLIAFWSQNKTLKPKHPLRCAFRSLPIQA